MSFIVNNSINIFTFMKNKIYLINKFHNKLMIKKLTITSTSNAFGSSCMFHIITTTKILLFTFHLKNRM